LRGKNNFSGENSMAAQTSELLEKIRQQFDSAPYPHIPLEDSPKDNIGLLYFHSLTTPYYQRNQKVIDTKDKVILDAGCGSGYKSLTLALANPDAKVIGVDISEQSVKLAEQRLAYHGIENAEFRVCGVEDLASLGVSFDYINCDELLYLFPSPAAALKSMGSVLKPEGIIRSNLHCAFQRAYLFRAQELFKTMGLMEDNPREMEIEIATETMKALRDIVLLKARTWDSSYEDEKAEEKMLMNYLFQGDKGYTIRDMFASFTGADLEFVKMVNWHRWNLLDLFKEPDNLPAYWAMSLPEVSEEDKLYLFELLHPIHRLIDFWCGHPNEAQSFIPVSEWEDSHWKQAKVYLHPQLKTPNFREELVKSVTAMKPFAIGQFLSLNGEDLILDSSMAHCLIPLLEQPQSMTSLVERWKQIRPLDPITLQQTEDEQAFYLIRQFLSNLEASGYILLEQQP
jgi:2-polyprenyl-3-methyl-5-hydroxy-6-metoxy-1,4-benzoquinol methylase